MTIQRDIVGLFQWLESSKALTQPPQGRVMQQGVSPISFRHLAMVIVVSLAVHIAFAIALFWQTPSSGAPHTGVGGIQIGLGMAGGAPGSVEEAPVPTEQTEVLEATEVTEEVSETEIAETPAEVVEEQVTTAETVEEPAEEVVSEVPLELEAEAPVEIAAEAVEAKPVEPVEEKVETVAQEAVALKVPEPPRAKPVLPRNPQPVAKEVVERKQSDTPKATEPAKVVEPETELTAQPGEVASVAGSDGQSGTKDRSAAGSGDSTAGGGQPGASTDFSALIQAWLEKHKKYPRRARTRRQQGTAILAFVMDREGNVLDYRITKSSGHKLLDTEVAAMIERASPLPTIPDDMGSGRLEVVVPVAFFLR